ncbi:porin family protein [Fulvivirga sedimenti]|uniref:PorT family protein n=1 Tax=Fulvivirga sedimenti TaxID=2879465 RepID=A0A9X1HU72_9BACT|nr:porin family protein [Fulvivirga sedimenti]MCA6078000.1 PorT family protein [Fulvivirga sedimenti]
MQTFNIRGKFNLRGRKGLIILILLVLPLAAFAQRRKQLNNPNYDRRWLTYGFLLQGQTSSYQIKYSDAFVSDSFDSVYAISPKWSTGFSLGFIVNFRLEEYFDLRLTPTVSFHEYAIDYEYVDEPVDNQLIESTVVELPVMLKYKSARRGNARMYFVGGVKPGFEVSGKNKNEDFGDDYLITKDFNFSGELGFGVDIYYPLFKFSPEIRFSKGFTNLLGDANNAYGAGLDRINTNTVSLILLFQ